QLLRATMPSGKIAPVTLNLMIKNAETIAKCEGGVHCGEKSVVAFAYVVSKKLPVAHVGIRGANHDFVIVGTNPLTPGNQYAVMTKKGPVDIFGPDAVACDPWYLGGVVYAIRDNWAPYFENSIKNAMDPKLIDRWGWDSSDTLSVRLKTSQLLECFC